VAKHPLNGPVLRIGRDPEENDVFIDDKVVSMLHAVVETEDDKSRPGEKAYYIRDLDSTNYTFVNDEKITRRRLQNDDLIRIGWTTFKFVDRSSGQTEKTLKIHKSWIPGVYYTKE
jgi:pSer/pThr/pTyr-binding forkhead associated (FHA) protein